MDARLSRRLNRRWNCHLTTTGRKSGKPRSVTIWFVLEEDTLFLTGGAKEPQWCRNLRACGEARVVIGAVEWMGVAEVIEDAGCARRIRQKFVGKYWLARIARPFGGYTRSVPVRVSLFEPRENP